MEKREKLLLIDSVSTDLYVALIDGEVITSRVFSGAREHDRNLNILVRGVLADAGAAFSDLGAVAVVNGPGSWTGTRVGVVAAKAYALAAGLPVIALKHDTRESLIARAKARFSKKEFTNARALAPYYDGEFQVTPPKHKLK